MENKVTPADGKKILENVELVEKIAAAGGNSEKIEELLKGAGFTPDKISEMMNSQEAIDDSALERIGGGAKVAVPEPVRKAIEYAKENPLQAASKVLKVAATVATPIVAGVGAHQINKTIKEGFKNVGAGDSTESKPASGGITPMASGSEEKKEEGDTL